MRPLCLSRVSVCRPFVSFLLVTHDILDSNLADIFAGVFADFFCDALLVY